MKGILVCSNEEPRPFPSGDNYEITEIYWQNLKILSSRTTGPISTKLGTKHPLVKGIRICWNEGPQLFFKGRCLREIAKMHWRNFKIFFSRTTMPISTKHGAKHPWVKGIHVCSNEGFRHFPMGDSYAIAKMHCRNLIIFFSRNIVPILTKLGTKHPWVKGIPDSSSSTSKSG